MSGTTPFVVVVTGVTGKVGKSTVANNLAVYLKAFREDLPVTLLSFDKCNNPDAMFRLGGEEAGTVADLFAFGLLEPVASLGQFGVNYLATYGELPQIDGPARLRHILRRDDRTGVVIIDAGCDQNDLWRSAIWAADLVLTPVGDHRSLSRLRMLRRSLLEGGGCEEMLWLLPSRLGEAVSSDTEGESGQFLRFAAEERNCQVLDHELSEDQRVHLQAVCKDRSVLTRLPGSYVHVELRQIAEFVLQKIDEGPIAVCFVDRMLSDGQLPVRARRVDLICPLCGVSAVGKGVHYLEAAPSRHRALLHGDCLDLLLEGTSLQAFLPMAGQLLLRTGVEGQELRSELRLYLMGAAHDIVEQQQILPDVRSGWDALLRHVTGRGVNEQVPGLLAISASGDANTLLTSVWQRRFAQLRRKGFRRVCGEEG